MTEAVSEVAKAGPIWGTGRRKSAVARVRLMPGKGAFLVNQREVDQYFSEEKDRLAVRSPLLATQRVGAYDILVSVHGGGPSGQADAVKLGIARALLKADASLDQALRNGKFLTRDPRMPERKKYGRAGARRSFQFSKR